ncbi:MAG TPA: DUF120 domain-containing protein [Alloacidobacterium sp.]|nr:DUF120 domain-containing protein [Alloacidobacterium sp.]
MPVLKGVVVSGMKNFSFWLEKLESFYMQKTGMRLFPGTLNLRLAEPYSLPTDVIRLENEEYGGTVSVSLLPCTIFGRRAFLLRPTKTKRDKATIRKTLLRLLPISNCAMHII